MYEAICRIVFTAVLVVAITGPAAAQTPDGETPANEGVCDELMYGATKGLYGLCVAFCEAQDCEFNVEDPLAGFEECKPSSPKLLELYRKKMGAGDPDMPCVQQSECPCWGDSLALADLPMSGTFQQCVAANTDAWAVSTDLTNFAVVGVSNVVSPTCFFQVPGTFVGLDISQEEYDICRGHVIESGMARGFDCWDQ